MLPPWIWGVVDLWFAARRFANPITGGTSPPCPGGPGEQPASLMDAHAIIEAQESERA